MRYWPKSVIANSPLMPPAHAWEAAQAGPERPLSIRGMQACNYVAERTKSFAGDVLTVIDSEDAFLALIYTDYPEFDDWFRLERAGFVATERAFVFCCFSLH